MIRRWHILICGFTQKPSESGMSKIWREARRHSSESTCVTIHTWKSDWEELAKFIDANADPMCEIFIHAYSWGAGWGFVKLSEQLNDRGRKVRLANLCDPVYRNPYLPTWFNFTPRSLWGERTILVPPNVLRVRWVYQTQNKPAGHRPEATWQRTIIEQGVLLTYTHAGMEDSPEFRDMVLSSVEQGR